MKHVLPSVDDMINGKACRFALVIAVAKRARDIISDHEMRGEPIEENAVSAAAIDFKNRICTIAED
ncbi:MAG: DNA-directed RNA polymerase subunit omega [Oscillospiraceae bacterium]|jgi:DNA-directed RNA polymerase subunit K/omega|nr:DNA-directed RNA polymerase subunit omega [Oscillospiraceae bacterium]